MKKAIALSLILGTFTVAGIAAAETVAEEDSVKADFTRTYPMMPAEIVSKTPISGMYEIVSGDKVFYYTPSTGHVIVGALWSKEGENLTAKTLEKVTSAKAQANFTLLNASLDKAIKVGNGKNVVIEITDPDCPYCRKMHDYWKTRKDVTRYVFMMPIPQLHPNAEAKSKYILASADREKAMDDVFSGKFDAALPEAGNDKGLLAVHQELTSKTGIRGTPAFFVNGTFVHGANIPAIEKVIGAAEPAAGETKAPDTTDTPHAK